LFNAGDPNSKVILGIAPYDFRLWLLAKIFRNYEIYIHNSWPNWNSNLVPKKFMFKVSKKYWQFFFLNKIAGFFAVSTSTIKSVELAFEKPIYNSSVVYHSCEDFWFEKINTQIRSKRFIYVGRIEKDKGIGKIISLASNQQDYEFHIIGSGKLEHLLLAYNGDNMSFLGYISDRKKLRKAYDQSSFLLMPSIRSANWEEAFGISIIEAMSRGVIPITTDHAGPKEILTGELRLFVSTEQDYENHVDYLITTLTDSQLEYYSQQVIERAKAFSVFNISKKWAGVLTWKS